MTIGAWATYDFIHLNQYTLFCFVYYKIKDETFIPYNSADWGDIGEEGSGGDAFKFSG